MAEYGILGYGIYFSVIEMIARKLTPENITCELENNIDSLARKFSGDKFKVTKDTLHSVIDKILELKLFTKTLDDKLECLKLLKKLDTYMGHNPEIRTIIKKGKDKL
jgi:hypothetical protein